MTALWGSMQQKLLQILRHWGILGMTILITALSILFSICLRIFIQTVIQDRSVVLADLSISALIPLIIAPIMAIVFSRLLKVIDDAEQRNARLVAQLQEALAQTKRLSGLLPICASCKKIRDDEGYWHQVEAYFHERSEVGFSHGMCPDCQAELVAQIAARKRKQYQ